MKTDRNRGELLGKKFGELEIIGLRDGGGEDRGMHYLDLNIGIDICYQAHAKNHSIVEYIEGPTPQEPQPVFIVGNGPSLANTDLDRLIGYRSFAVNRIWKLWEELRPDLKWRPTDYVRLEKNDAKTDVLHMAGNYQRMYLQRGVHNAKGYPNVSYFMSCGGKDGHGWHLPLLCAYGTAVHTAMQIAVKEGATALYLVGCDMGMSTHFYGSEGDGDAEWMAQNAHAIAKESCPVPIYNATVGGNLEYYPRITLDEIQRKVSNA